MAFDYDILVLHLVIIILSIHLIYSHETYLQTRCLYHWKWTTQS